MSQFRVRRSAAGDQSKLPCRARLSGAAMQVVEALEQRCLLSAGDVSTAQAAILAAVPSGMQGQFVGSQLDLAPAARQNVATPRYVLLDRDPSLVGVRHLAGFDASTPSGYSPAQLRHAYGIDNIQFGSITGDGTGQTIAIIDAYDDPDIAGDLQAFDDQYGLPAPPSFTKVNQDGDPNDLPGTDPEGKGDSWEVEESLDVEWAHAIAPAASIILVEANSPDDSDLISAAVDWARQAPGVSAISMSFSESEYSGETSLDSFFTTPQGHNGVTFLAATGDEGSPSGYPAYSPNVVAVGGTTLNLNSSGNVTSETAWSGSGGGISLYESQPAYQQGVVTQTSSYRTNPDVSFDADPNTGVAVYDSYDFGTSTPWVVVGGTSLATPCWAGLIAIADQGRVINGAGTLDGATQTLPHLYATSASNFRDITSGSNGGYSAGPGYDLVTGRGSPLANTLVPYLSSAGPYVTTYTPSGLQSTAPSSIDFTFSTPMNPTSFSVSADVDAFTGPGNTNLLSSITGYSWLNNNTTLAVDFTQPTAQGPYSLTIGPNILSASGSEMDQNQNGVNGEVPGDEFTGTFNYDVTPTYVLSTNPAAGSDVTPPFTTLDLYLSAACDPASVSTGNLTISQGTISAAALVNSTTVQYTLSGILNSGTISINLAQGALKDTNENPVLAFSGSYIIPTPPTPGAPSLLAATDSGISNSDGITNFDNSTPARAPQFSVPGTVPGDVVYIYADGTLIGSATATSQTTVVTGDGKTALTTGIHQFTARQGPYGGEGVDSPATAISILATPPSLPVAGAFDSSFNFTGTVVGRQIPGDGVLSEAIQTDGKILAGGDEVSDGTSYSPIVARYTSDGQLDPTFGTNGYVTLPSSTEFEMAVVSIALQTDGKIILLATPYDGAETDLEVARLNPDGTFDTSFGSGGIAMLDPDGMSDSLGASVLVQPDGKLVVAGAIEDEAAMFRLNADGTLDTTYGGGTGYVTDPVSDNFSFFQSAALESNGDIVATGDNIDDDFDFSDVTARFLPSGALDTTFNGDGNASPSFGTADNFAVGIAPQTDGKLVLTAETDEGVALLRLNANGSVDTTFGTGGLVSLDEYAISPPVVQSDGKIVVAGDDETDSSYGGFIDRFNANGSFDTTFNGTGQLLTQIGPQTGENYFNIVAVQPDGNIVAGGISQDPSGQNGDVWTLARVDGTTASVALDPASDSGISNSDRITNVTTPTFDVSYPSNLYVRIYRDGTLVSPAYATGPTITLGTQPPGTHQYTMTLVDAAGNESVATAPYSVTIDTTPPTVQFGSVASGPSPVNSVSIVFSEPVYGLTLAELSLTRNGAAVPLTSSQTLTTSDNQTWVLGNLASLTATPGSYQLELLVSPDVTDVAGNALAGGAIAVWSLGSSFTATSTALAAQGPNPSNATQSLTFTASVTGGVPNGETVNLVDTSENGEVVASGTLSGGSATLTIPAMALSAGTHNLIAVYGGDANFAPSQSAPYTQTVLPAVTGISPSSGPAGGGTTVTITGSGFTGATAVDFGSAPSSSFTINQNGTLITAVAPAGTLGATVDITVVTPGGTSLTSVADQFTYIDELQWLETGSQATWNASTDTLTVTGAATIIADPGGFEPNIVASGSAAVLTIAPTTNDVDIHIGGVTLTDGASIVMSDVDASQVADGTNASNHYTDHNVLVIGTLGAVNDPTISIDSASKLDLGDNDLIVHTGSSDTGTDDVQGFPETTELKAIEALAVEGRNVALGGVYNGTWTGNGLTSSAAATADDSANAGYEQNILAVEQNSDMYLGGYSSWTVGSATEKLGANDIIVKYTYNGDLNLDGAVDGNAATIFSTFYDGGATSGNTYAYGDLNGDGKIDGNDATIFSTVYGNGLAGSGLPQL